MKTNILHYLLWFIFFTTGIWIGTMAGYSKWANMPKLDISPEFSRISQERDFYRDEYKDKIREITEHCHKYPEYDNYFCDYDWAEVIYFQTHNNK